MPNEGMQSPLRMLAPLALVVFAIAFFAVLLSSDSDEGSPDRSAAQGQRAKGGGARGARPRQRPRRDVYTVKTGDTLAGIAANVGVSVERLQELNPELDPQALVSGQKIQLRE
jgi:hypothetical protein